MVDFKVSFDNVETLAKQNFDFKAKYIEFADVVLHFFVIKTYMLDIHQSVGTHVIEIL